MKTQNIPNDQRTFEDFWQVMGERGAIFEVLMEAGLSANEAVKGTIDEGTDMEYWHIPPLEIGKEAQAKVIKSQGGIKEIREFLAFNADWDEYKGEFEL